MTVVEKIIIDLNNLTPESLQQANDIMKNVENSLRGDRRRKQLEQKVEFEAISTQGAQTLREKIFGKETVGILFDFAKNPIGVLGSLLQRIPGPLMLAIPIIVEIFNRLIYIVHQPLRAWL